MWLIKHLSPQSFSYRGSLPLPVHALFLCLECSVLTALHSFALLIQHTLASIQRCHLITLLKVVFPMPRLPYSLSSDCVPQTPSVLYNDVHNAVVHAYPFLKEWGLLKGRSCFQHQWWLQSLQKGIWASDNSGNLILICWMNEFMKLSFQIWGRWMLSSGANTLEYDSKGWTLYVIWCSSQACLPPVQSGIRL